VTGSPERTLEHLASLATAGDAAALDELLRRVQQPMYRLSLRFLGHPADAEDATQEILIRLTTHLASFEGRSAFTTWAYTIAFRMLLRTRKRAVEASVVSAEQFASFLDANLADRDFPAEAAEYRELCEEVRVSCTYGMLLCLSRPVRAAYLLGDVLGVTDQEGAEICGVSPAAFRQRLARGRATIRRIVDGRCGVVDSANPCRCGRQIEGSIAAGIMRRDQRVFADHPRDAAHVRIDRDAFERAADQIESVVAIGDLYRRDRFAAPATVWARLREAMPDLIDA
jgi:RNA polymerase sigma factor (sigma-70 family)